MSGLPPAGNGPQYTALQPYYPINQILTIIFGALYVPLFFVALWMHRQKPGYASNLVALFVYSQIAFYVFRVLVARSDPSKEYQVVACDSLGFLGAVLFVIAVANYMSEKPDKEVFNNSGPDYTMIEEQPLRPHQLSKSRINWLDVSYPIRVLVTAGAVAAEVVEVLGILLQTNSSGSLDINNALWMRRGASFFLLLLAVMVIQQVFLLRQTSQCNKQIQYVLPAMLIFLLRIGYVCVTVAFPYTFKTLFYSDYGFYPVYAATEFVAVCILMYKAFKERSLYKPKSSKPLEYEADVMPPILT
jgi:hypothetical protein